MTIKHPLRYVFLDTEVFVTKQFGFGIGDLHKLRTYLDHGFIKLISTDITRREISARLSESVEKARAAHKKFRSVAAALATSSNEQCRQAVAYIDFDAVRSDLENQLCDFFDNCIDVDCYQGSAEVFDWYFDRKPPFGTGRKKHEFPDAFVVAALARWAEEVDASVFIVSNDQDMVEACESLQRFTAVDRVERLLDRTNRQFKAQLMEAFESLWPEIEEEIDGTLGAMIFMVADHVDGHGQSPELKNIDRTEVFLLDHSNETATFFVNAELTFEIDIRYPDPEMTFYDKEDGVTYQFGSIEKRVESAASIEFEAYAGFDPSNPSDAELYGIRFDQGMEIEIDPELPEIPQGDNRE